VSVSYHNVLISREFSWSDSRGLEVAPHEFGMVQVTNLRCWSYLEFGMWGRGFGAVLGRCRGVGARSGRGGAALRGDGWYLWVRGSVFLGFRFCGNTLFLICGVLCLRKHDVLCFWFSVLRWFLGCRLVTEGSWLLTID